MSDSKLATYVKISPNCHHPRNKKIDTITIHHMAGNLTVERCGEIFQNTKREASSNYGIGTDGRIALYVHEADRAWTSGSPANDHRAITIEVANDGGAETNWHVGDKAMASLIDLLEDVCRRNGIKKLVWSDKKEDRVGHKNGCNMTVHRDFQATACPGPYLYSKQAFIANEVNKRLEGEEKVTYEQWKEYAERYEKERSAKPVDGWAEPFVDWAKKNGIMVGDPDGNFRGQDPIRREESAATSRAVIKAIAGKLMELAE